MPSNWMILIPALFMLLSGCSDAPTSIPEIDSSNAYVLAVKLVTFGKRYSGTAENRKQAEFIAAKAAEYGALVSIDHFACRTVSGLTEFANITAEIKGKSSNFIIIGSHYDIKRIASVPDFEGANDSASSSALLLEMIRAIKSSGDIPPVTLKFVFFDGEECQLAYSKNDGLWGSRHYADKLKSTGLINKCLAVIVLDMIGDADLGVTLPVNSDRKLVEKVLEAASELGYSQYFNMYNFEILDDHQPFLQLGIPAVDIIDFEYGAGNAYWHTGADKIDKISRNSLKIIGNCTLRLVFNSIY